MIKQPLSQMGFCLFQIPVTFRRLLAVFTMFMAISG
ncbi:hypothetical protein CsSME_00023787 [Camellia sinensis var. sinensis]